MKRRLSSPSLMNIVSAPSHWRRPCANSEISLHQLSPYIGKLKSSIAGELVERYSVPGDLVVDPFAGAGTIPLESVIRGRRTLAADISSYAAILSKAKLNPPRSMNEALVLANDTLAEAARLPSVDLRQVPAWVRKFFHPDTLREILNFANVCRRPGKEYLMACFLGILHHQRPGFLSYPSSHLVPYLRDKKYPRERFPEMYCYRELKLRLLAKINRSFKRFIQPRDPSGSTFVLAPVQQLELPSRIGALITSPPYMNALDYSRDNRLRSWFVDPNRAKEAERDVTNRRQAFIDAITALATNIAPRIRRRGYCVLVVGEAIRRSFDAHPSEAVIEIMRDRAPSLRLKSILADRIPDVRRTRKDCKAVKTEHTLVFQR